MKMRSLLVTVCLLSSALFAHRPDMDERYGSEGREYNRPYEHVAAKKKYHKLFVDAKSTETTQNGAVDTPFQQLQDAFAMAATLPRSKQSPVVIIVKKGEYTPEDGKEGFELPKHVLLLPVGKVTFHGAFTTVK